MINVPPIFRISDNITIETVKAMFFDGSLIESPEPVYRLVIDGERMYYKFEGSRPKFYPSVTTCIKQNMETGPQLLDWLVRMGPERGEQYSEERAHYGTFLHIETAEYIIAGSLNLDDLPKRLAEYILIWNLPMTFMGYEDILKRDVLAWAQFVEDYNYVPISVEIVLTSDAIGTGGALDHVGYISYEKTGFWGETTQKGLPKKTKKFVNELVIIDIKSGRKGFWSPQKVQLHTYWRMWTEHFPNLVVESVWNWSPKDWTGEEPTYNFVNQTDTQERLHEPLIMERAMIKFRNSEKKIPVITGVVERGKGTERNIQKFTLEEFVIHQNNLYAKSQGQNQKT